MDEPTAALDTENEAEVMRAVDRLLVGRTALIITHQDLSTIGKVKKSFSFRKVVLFSKDHSKN